MRMFYKCNHKSEEKEVIHVGECEISDTIHGRAKACQGFGTLASWNLAFGDKGELRTLGRRLRGGNLPRLRQRLQAGKFQENRKVFKMPLVRYMSLNY